MSELKHLLMLSKERSWVPCYLKSDADKVIADKDEQLRHSNYKKCSAMAKWCGSEVFVSDYEKDEPRMRWWIKWHKRWLELAKKFKLNNSTDQ